LFRSDSHVQYIFSLIKQLQDQNTTEVAVDGVVVAVRLTPQV